MQFLSFRDLNNLAKQPDMTISVEGKMGKINYRASNSPIKKLLLKVGIKIKEMSSEMSTWTVDGATQYNLDFMNTSIDWEYDSLTVLVGNIPLDVVLKPLTADVMSKINKAIQLTFPMARMDKTTTERLSSGAKYWIAPGDLGATGFNGGKVSILVDLITPVRVGIGLNGGSTILARPKVDMTNGEYYMRQFLNEEEANFLRLLNQTAGNYMLAAFRQLNTVPEAQDLTRRCIKQSLTEIIGTEVHVFPISGKHLWGQEGDYKEETILIAMTQVEDGGKVLSEILEIPQENPIFRMCFGSLEVQGHMSMSTVLNKKFFDSEHRLNVRVLPRIEKDTDMVRVHQLYNTLAQPISALVKRPLNQSFDTWIAILSNPADVNLDVSSVMDRSPSNKKKWPTAHPIINWNGSAVNIGRSVMSSVPSTPPSKEEDAGIGVDEGWNTYRRADRKSRSNSFGSRDGGGSRSDSNPSDSSRSKRKNGSLSESDGTKSDDNSRAKPRHSNRAKRSLPETQQGASLKKSVVGNSTPITIFKKAVSVKEPEESSGSQTDGSAKKILKKEVPRKGTNESAGSQSNSSAKKVLRFAQKMEKVMSLSPLVAETDEDRCIRESKETMERLLH